MNKTEAHDLGLELIKILKLPESTEWFTIMFHCEAPGIRVRGEHFIDLDAKEKRQFKGSLSKIEFKSDTDIRANCAIIDQGCIDCSEDCSEAGNQK